MHEESAEESMSAQSSDYPPKKECVIIVGAFSSKDNIQNMQSRLSEQGYTVYLSDVQSLTRVGVYAPCPSREILQELRTIRQEIEPAAWILNE
jgi:cell division septation protein DedD